MDRGAEVKLVPWDYNIYDDLKNVDGRVTILCFKLNHNDLVSTNVFRLLLPVMCDKILMLSIVVNCCCCHCISNYSFCWFVGGLVCFAD